jgi:Flp pilus assembly protein TadG
MTRAIERGEMRERSISVWISDKRSAIERIGCRLREDSGASLIEMALSSFILLAILFGIVQMSLALYVSHYVSDAAREATRFAMVRGGNCTNAVKKTYCSPTDGLTTGADNTDIQTYIQNLGFPYSSQITSQTTWFSASSGTPTTWTSCGSTKCNSPGNLVQVTVTCNYPIAIPFWTVTSLTIKSTSAKVIVQ